MYSSLTKSLSSGCRYPLDVLWIYLDTENLKKK